MALGCEGGPIATPARTSAPEAPAQVATPAAGAREPAVVDLRFDQPLSVGQLRLSWLELNDSRCPLGAQCFWEGEAIVTLEASTDRLAARRVELRLRPGTQMAPRSVDNHELQLVAVEPYPQVGATHEREEYVATLEIRIPEG